MLSATIERMTQRSSTQVARWGKSSLTAVPHWPYCLKDHGDCKRFPVLVRSSLGFSNGSGWPLSLASRGFGSKVSTCEGPPDMNKKMMRLALAGNCGGLTSKGLADAPSAAKALEK